MKKTIKLDDLILDAGTQVRASIDEATVEEYSQLYKAKTAFPPIHVFVDGNRYLVADGFHRVLAKKRAGFPSIEAMLHHGTRVDCLKFGIHSNMTHGLRWTNADKRHAVGIALGEFPKLADRAIAEMCGVSHTFVAEIRPPQLATVATVPSVSGSKSTLPAPQTRVGRDGVARKLPPVPVRLPPSVPMPPPKALPVPIRSMADLPSTVPQKSGPRESGHDSTGFLIPPGLIPQWHEAEGIQTLLNQLSNVRSLLRKHQEENDPIFVRLNFSSVLSALDGAYTELKACKPYAVCPTCQGLNAGQCRLCKGLGFIGEFLWTTAVPRETKELRFKAMRTRV